MRSLPHLFSAIANKYDLMNDLMSCGMHRYWKKKFCDQIQKGNVLDVATGTGDIAIRWYKRNPKKNHRITLCDPSKAMLNRARRKARENGVGDAFGYIHCSAEEMEAPDNAFDNYTISFGMRNVSNREKALEESFRVLKSGGKFLCLEFSRVDFPLIRQLYDFYSFHIIPRLGSIVLNDARAYRYLVESIRQFPNQDAFCALLQKTGFEKIHYNALHFGIVTIYSAYKLKELKEC